MNRFFHALDITIEDQEFRVDDSHVLPQTACVTFLDADNRRLHTGQYGVVDTDSVYERLAAGQPVNLNNCYIRNFSLATYRERYGHSETTELAFPPFSAANALFRNDQLLDFSLVAFPEGGLNFANTKFRGGGVSFYKCRFGDGDVDFTNAYFGKGQVNFQFTDFGSGTVFFENAVFREGEVSFVNAHFGMGNVDFRNAWFGPDAVDFHFSRFGTGNVNFDKAVFKGEKVDFRKTEFGKGKVDFKRCDFGTADLSFEEVECGPGRINFNRSRFLGRNVAFTQAEFSTADVHFDNAILGQVRISFLGANMSRLSLKSCQFNDYLDLRVNRASSIDLSNAIIRDIVDLKPGEAAVTLDSLQLQGIRNLGRIYIDWRENRVAELVGSQDDTTYAQKANQFRILKEDFHSAGQYDDEDRAYVAFRRFELRSNIERAVHRNPLNAIWVYPAAAFQHIVFDRVGRYATDPVRVLLSMCIVYVLFSVAFIVIPKMVPDAAIVSSLGGSADKLGPVATAFYHSAITFLTIGYGDFYPSGVIRWLSGIEGFVGLFLMSYFTVAFVRKILR
ncbi:MAG: ion channel [Bacteroidota bacterium]